jgi:hypothetical protein
MRSRNTRRGDRPGATSSPIVKTKRFPLTAIENRAGSARRAHYAPGHEHYDGSLAEIEALIRLGLEARVR